MTRKRKSAPADDGVSAARDPRIGDRAVPDEEWRCLVEKLRAKEAALRRIELRFNQLAENIEQVFWVSDQAIGDFVYLSPHCNEVLGVDCRQFVSDAALRRRHVHPEDLERHEAAITQARRGEASHVEYRIHHPRKGLRWLQVRSFPFDEHGRAMNAGLVEDVTERKRAEQLRLEDSLRLRDALTREVHHRIKNNLQTVVGLLRREAGKHPQAREAIESAVAQVQSVAVVHGLYGQGMQRDIMLCELLPAIVANVAALSGVPIGRKGVHESCNRFLIQESETVAVALILNELITNAVKHAATEGTGDRDHPLVKLTRKGATGRIHIANPGHLPEGFDFVAGRKLGTGIGLVRALMPSSGMSIHFTQTDSQVVTEIVVEPPVLKTSAGEQSNCEGQTYEKCADRR